MLKALKYITRKWLGYTLLSALFTVLPLSINAQVLNIADGATFHQSPNSVVSVNGGMKIFAGGSYQHSNSGVSSLWFSGKFENYGTYIQNTLGLLRFYRSLDDSIAGNDIAIERLWIMKTGSAMVSLSPGTDVTINQALRLISNNILNIHRSNLTIEETAMIYPDSTAVYTADPLLDPFNNSKFIMTSGEKQLSGAIIRKLPENSSLTNDLSLRFPIGTPHDTLNPVERNYSPSRFVFNAGEATMGANSFMSMRCICAEHASVEVVGVSLHKYWKTEYNDIIVAPGGYNVRFNYQQSEVQGFEELYMLSLFYRPYDGPNGTYYINAGAGYGVEPVNNRFYVDEVNQKDTLGHTQLLLDGEWTAGQAEAVSTFYYSLTDGGDWTNPGTWSKQGYSGAPASSYPTTINDKVFIGNGKTVVISTPTPLIKSTKIENTGRLAFSAYNATLQGDSLFVEPGGTIAISSDDGITASGIHGNVQTTHRSYSQSGKYEYFGNRKQVTGNGLPDIIGSIIINKSALSDTVSLTKSVLVKDSLVINQGTFHLFRNGNFTAHGETGDTTNRRIIMRGGEFSMQNFPTKYKNGVFTAGTITFDGTGSFRIPSSVSPGAGEPAVTQFNDLKLKGARGANTYVTLDPSGTIRILGDLNISGLSFNPTPISDRFIVTGSTVAFNGSGSQDIQTGYSAATALIYRLKFHNLNIEGSGDKNIMPPNDIDSPNNYVLVRNFVNLKSGNLVSNDHHIKVLHSWFTDPGATFQAGAGLVTFEADGKITNIKSSNIQFNNVNIVGTAINGIVNYLDSMTVGGNLTINPANFRDLNNTAISVRGNFINQGIFTSGTGRVYFNGTSGDQALIHNGKGTFYNLTVNKSTGMVRLNGDSAIKVMNDLTLQQGNIGGRNSDSLANKTLIVDGTITRPPGTPGHVDGRLSFPTTEGAFSRLLPLGLGADYAPMQFDINGSGGAIGYLDAYVISQASAPGLSNTVLIRQEPNGPELDVNKTVQKVWIMHADTSKALANRFELGAARSYNIEFFFPATDVRNGAITGTFEIGQRDTTATTDAANNGRWTKPFMADRNPLSTKFSGNQNFKNTALQYFILGEPQVFTYYSIADGNWNVKETWSTAGYLSTEPATRAPLSIDNIRIGNGKVVTLNVDHNVNANRLVAIETGARDYPNGHLIFNSDTRLLTGAGTFRLDSGGAITIRHANGISTTAGANGCIQTTNRDYNYNNHGMGHFIYGRVTAGNQSVGNGLPFFVRTLQCDQSTNTQQLTFPAYNVYRVSDSIHIRRGNVVFSTVNTKLGGNFIVEQNGQYDFGTQTVNASYTANPSTGQQDSSSARPGGLMFTGVGTQNFWVKRANPDSIIIINRLSLVKPSGKIISRNNINAGQLFFHEGNRANFNCMNFNKWIWARVNVLRLGGFTGNVNTDPGWTMLHDPLYGYVEGRLLRSINNNRRQFPIGTPTKYTPMDIEMGNVGTVGNGLVEVQAIDGNHRLFNTNNINQNTNIQRYYEISLPVDTASTLVIGNNASLTFRARVIFTEDEPRGGINPVNYDAFRLSDTNTISWTNVTNILTDSNTATQMLFNLNTAPRLTGNNIFNVKSEFSNAKSITFMIGETPPAIPERIFYSKQSGNWTDPNTWSYSAVLFQDTETGYALNTNTENDYPRRNNGTSKDFAIIGDGDSVYYDMNTVDLRYVLLEKSAGGMGKLYIPSANDDNSSVINTEQFVQKNGGKLYIGHRRGITDLDPSSADEGCIRRLTATSILNYDLNSLGVNNFAYVRTHNNIQGTGAALPSTVASLEINYSQSAADRYVDLTNDANLTIKDSLVFKNGRLRNRDGNRTITILGNIVNNSTDVGFHNQINPANRRVIFTDTLTQNIRGTARETRFVQPVYINKSGGSITTDANIRFNDSLMYYSDILFNVSDFDTLSFGETAFIDSLDRFSSKRLFKVSGGPNTAKLRKIYTTSGSPQSFTFTFPVGEDSLGLRAVRYGEARFTLTSQTFSANNYLELTLRSLYPHPNAPSGSPNMLGKYWSVNTSSIARGSGTTSARFRYNDAEVRGNILNYRPALYRRLDVGGVNNEGTASVDPGWSFELFNASNSQIDTTNKFIIVDNAEALPNHDWTAGNPTSFQRAKIFWSIASANWSKPNTWTNYNNGGSPHTSTVPALNTPGFFPGDTVLIGNTHIVSFDQTPRNYIDSLGVGVALSTSPELRFLSADNVHKSLYVRGSLTIGSTGLISKETTAFTSRDTLFVSRNFNNTGNAGRGVSFHPNILRNIQLEFIGNTSSYLQGEGNYTSLGTVRVAKTDSTYNLFNESQTFSNRFTTDVTAITSVDFKLDAGMYYHNNAANITLSKDGDGDVFLGDKVGLVVQNGNVTYSDGLICGQNASVRLLNGNLTIGNSKGISNLGENFQYESTTIIDIQGNSRLLIAGAMRRRFLTSAVNFSLKDNAQIEVMRIGAKTNSAERRAAFDFGEANSVFTMTGGKVIIYRPMELSIASEKDPDYYVNTTVSTVTGGTVQFGHADSTVVGAEPFNLIASTPFWNLDLAKTYGNDLFLSSPIVTVLNDLTVRDFSILNQNGNTLNIGGDLTLDGTYKSGTIGPRRVSFFGNSTTSPATKQIQSVKIKGVSNDPLYDLVINKSNGGSVDLSNDGGYSNSNFILKNTLEFSIGNQGLINTGTGRYVQVGTTDPLDLASIQRFGLGHVNGELRRWVNDGAHDLMFTVGTATDYTPAEIVTSVGTGTPGWLSVTAYGIVHPDLAGNTLIQSGTNLNRYWRVIPVGTSPFALGSGRDFSLDLYWKKGITPAGDQPIGSSFGTFEHFRRTPEYNFAGDWFLTTPNTRSDSTTSSKTNSAFGDFIIAEIAGARFFSRQSGNWNTLSTWSTVSYDGVQAARLPTLETDRVYIGKGRTVTINASNPKIRSATIEEVSGLAGKLVILDERYLRGLSFELNDNCHLATDDAFGFTNVAGPTPSIGAVRTTSVRYFGKGIIEYVGQQGQAMGDGPTNPKTLIVNNSGLVNKTVSFSTVNYTVEDSIYVKQGFLSMGNSNVVLKGNLVSDNTTELLHGVSTLSLTGTADQYFVMNDSSGMNLYNFNLNKPSGNLILTGLADTASLNIVRNLNFTAGNVAYINARTNNKRVVLRDDTTSITRTGTGHVDGLLYKRFGSGASTFTYQIGFGSLYLPAELTFSAGTGTAGYVSGIAMSPPNPNASRIDPVHKVNYYWILAPQGTFAMGTRLANTKFTFPPSQITNLTGGVPNNAILLRKSNPVETPLWKQREFAKLSWLVGEASVQITNPADYWTGLGEFYIGERYRLIFYSKQNGLWNDYNSWALDEARTIPALEGEYPNPSPQDLQDSVIIGKNDERHIINLNVASSTISGLSILHNGKLDLHNDGLMLANAITSPGRFSLLDSGTVSFGGTINPTTSVLNFGVFDFGTNSTIEFYGTQTLIPNPFGLTNYPGSVLINKLGTKIVNAPILIIGNLTVDEGAVLDIQAIDALSVRRNVFNRANIMNNGVLEIGN